MILTCFCSEGPLAFMGRVLHQSGGGPVTLPLYQPSASFPLRHTAGHIPSTLAQKGANLPSVDFPRSQIKQSVPFLQSRIWGKRARAHCQGT